ncbi:MAG: metal-dependent transcriptional regulator [Intestinimonas sp.]|jgi:DtxR family Mn-dependent transcriptional regulator|nr:metal-dependent transcriptional regulator [Intestinimonas sp.]
MEQRDTVNLSSSDRRYLTAIYQLSFGSKSHAVRPVDVAALAGVSRPSVTHALKRLQQQKIIFRIPQKGVTLTQEGYEIAESIQFRYHTVESFLETTLDVDQATAEQDAWNIERVVSAATICKMDQFNQKNAGSNYALNR